MPDIVLDSIGSSEAFGSPTIAFRYSGSGTIYIGSIGNTVPVATISFPLDLSWDINAAVESSISLTWDVGILPTYWFRVLGKCQPTVCPTSPVSTNNSCDSYTIKMVLATSAREVCQKLARSNWIWTIAELGRFSTPADNAVAEEMAAQGLIDINCNTLIPVPFFQYLDCLPFCLSGYGSVDMGAVGTVQDSFFSYVGMGGIHLDGTVDSTRPDHISGSGGMTISGSADVRVSQYSVSGSGGMTILGSAGVVSSQFTVIASGGMVLGGTVNNTSTSFNGETSGGVDMGGSADARVALRFISNGLGPIGPSFAGIKIDGVVGEVAEYYFQTAGTGGIQMGGTASTSSSYFAASGTGGVTIGGDVMTTSPDHHGVGSGGMSVQGTALAWIIDHALGTGGLSMSGSASAAIRLNYQGLGGITLGGETRTNRFFGSGGMYVGGSAGLRSTWKGLYVDSWGMDAVCENLEPVFGGGTAPLYVAPVTTVVACGADMPLTLQSSHNFNNSTVLTNFLHRNGFALPDIFDLTYRRISGTWRGNYHFQGRADETTFDNWDFLVEFGCTSDAYGLATAPVWKFSFSVFRVNQQTGQDYDTRVIVYLDPEPLASRFGNDGIDLNISINPFTKNVTVLSKNATVQSSAFFDGVGLFSTPSWKTTPFTFRLKAIGEFHKIPRYDILPIFPKAGEYAVT